MRTTFLSCPPRSVGSITFDREVRIGGGTLPPEEPVQGRTDRRARGPRRGGRSTEVRGATQPRRHSRFPRLENDGPSQPPHSAVCIGRSADSDPCRLGEAGGNRPDFEAISLRKARGDRGGGPDRGPRENTGRSVEAGWGVL